MRNTALAFILIAALAGFLAALGFALIAKGYTFGGLGLARLGELANAAAFMPLAALYGFAAALMMLLPLRAAGYVHAHAASPVHGATLVLTGTIVGLAAARFAFGDRSAPWRLADPQLLFAAGIVAAHLTLNHMRRNMLLRSVFFVLFLAAALACLFWTFRL